MVQHPSSHAATTPDRPGGPSRDFDLLDGGWYAGQPFDDWAWMREHAPVYWDAKNEVWALTRYDDVLAVEKDPATFSSHRAPRPHGDHLPMMISMDDPEHGRRRKLVSRGFTPRRVRDHEATIRRICTTIIDRGRADGASATSSGTSPRRCRCC